MAILTVSNLAMDFGGISSDTTSTQERDSDYSPTGVLINPIQPNVLVWDSPAVSNDTWLHFRVRTPTRHASSGSDGYWLTFKNSAGQDVARIEVNNGQIAAEAHGDSINTGTYYTLGSSTNVTLDVLVSFDAGHISVSIFVSGSPTPISTATAANVSAKTKPVLVFFDNYDIGNHSWLYSEFIVTDGEDTRGWRLATLEPNTNGYYTAWYGGASELGDRDSATLAQSGSGGERVSWNPTAYGGPASPSSVRAVVGKANVARGYSGSPSQVTQFLRISSTDYDGTAQVLAEGEQKAVIEVWDNNPNTANPWNTTDLAALEMGLLSST